MAAKPEKSLEDQITLENKWIIKRGRASAGTFRLNEKGIAFRRKVTGDVDIVNKDDVDCSKNPRWMRVARGFQLRVANKSGNYHFYDGFIQKEFDNLLKLFRKHYACEIKEQELTVKGWNWGDLEFDGPVLSFGLLEKKKTGDEEDVLRRVNPAFELPLNAVSNANVNKTEALLEFHQDEEAGNNDQTLESMRFVIPNIASSDEASTKSRAEQVVEKVLAKADIVQITGDAIASFPEMPCLTPRGRYEIELFRTFFRTHGKTYDYKILYESVRRLFLLPKPDQRHVYFVVHLDPPIRQGQTRYPLLVFQFPKEDETTVTLNLDGEEHENKLEGLEETQQGPTYEVLSKIFKALTRRKITVPGTFKSHFKADGVKCTHKAYDGFLFPLEKGFLFVHKPALFIRYDEVRSIKFDRVSASGGDSSRSFDFTVETRSDMNYEFKSIAREEYRLLFDFIENKKLRIHNIKQRDDVAPSYDDFGVSDDSEDDAYIRRMKAEGSGGGGGGQSLADVNMDSESDDDDFKIAESDESSVNEEYDSDPSSTDSSDSDSDSDSDEDEDDSEAEERKKKKEKKKAKKEKKRKEKEKKRKAKERKEKQKEKKRADKKKKKEEAKENKGSGGDDSDEDGEDGEFEEKSKPKKKAPKKKAKRDPNAPKRPQNAYMLFVNATREQTKEKNPEMSAKELLSELGRQWREMEQETKTGWETKAKQAKQDYTTAMEVYRTEHPEAAVEEEEEKEKKKPAKRKRDPNAPKKPQSSYFLFMADVREKTKADNPDLDHKQLTSKLGELWGSLSAEEKQVYTDKATVAKEKYKEEYAEYLKANPEAAKKQTEKKPKSSSSKSTATKTKTKKPKEDPKQPKLEFKSAEFIDEDDDRDD
eukprot:m.10670 g.10670  ORF g.10670 m.10670 type:complete len:874 (+) comp7463_c0_seq1:108-2729(+)